MSREQHRLPRTSVSHQVNVGFLPSFTSSPLTENFASLWPWQDDPINWFSRNDFGASTPITAEINVSHMALIPLQPNVGPTDNLVMMTCLHQGNSLGGLEAKASFC
ncbi:hypothetical protein ACSBR1_020931 [Camellia fascicularis]